MAEMIDVEVWVLIDEAGDYAIAKDDAALVEAYENDVQSIGDAGCTRRVKVSLEVPRPEPMVLSGTVPAEPSEGKLTVA
ncbi:MAG: hypothetical protein IT429_17040 [Gemmataceae bacterium]|nr:hypothetical protein [Gemmataceae bacterium]